MTKSYELRVACCMAAVRWVTWIHELMIGNTRVGKIEHSKA